MSCTWAASMRTARSTEPSATRRTARLPGCMRSSSVPGRAGPGRLGHLAPGGHHGRVQVPGNAHPRDTLPGGIVPQQHLVDASRQVGHCDHLCRAWRDNKQSPALQQFGLPGVHADDLHFAAFGASDRDVQAVASLLRHQPGENQNDASYPEMAVAGGWPRPRRSIATPLAGQVHRDLHLLVHRRR